MDTCSKNFIRRCSALALGCLGLIALNIFILNESTASAKTSISATHTKSLRGSVYTKNLPPEENITVTSLSFDVKTTEKIFKKGKEIGVTCIVKNTSNKTVGGFTSIIRTPTKTLKESITKNLAPGEEIKLSGNLQPEQSGVVPLACRADLHNVVQERTDQDNKEIALLYVQG